MGVEFKGQDGKVKTFDAVSYFKENAPNARITGYDASSGTIKFDEGKGEQEFDLRSFMSDNGMVPTGAKSFNEAETALDSSPVSSWQRFRLGLATSESADIKNLYDIIAKNGSSPEIDARLEENQHRAVSILKKEFEDAKISNGEFVVKQKGVWHKVNAPGGDRGDTAEFIGANGLNILGSIAGGVLGGAGGSVVPGAGTAAGVAGGAAAGGMAGEGVENLLSYAIEQDKIDHEGLAKDLLTEGLTSLVGEGVAKAGVAGVKATGRAAIKATPDAVKNFAAASVENSIRGLKGFASKADAKIKDMVASLYGTIGPGMSKAPTRAMLESPETVQRALMYGKKYKLNPVEVQDAMESTLQKSLETVKKANQDRFGEVMKEVSAKADDSIEVNLDDITKNLELILRGGEDVLDTGAARQNRNFLDPVIGQAKEMAAKLKGNKKPSILLDASGNVIDTGEKPAILRGAKAIEALSELKKITGDRLDKIGVYSATGNVSVDPLTLDAAIQMHSLIDKKILNAADSLNLKDSVKAARNLYGETKDVLNVVRARVFSEKASVGNITKIARDELGPDVSRAFTKLDSLPGGKAVTNALNEVRLMQSGIETADWLAVPKEATKQMAAGGGAVAAATANPVMGLAVTGAMLSPKGAALIARNLTSSGTAARVAGKGAKLTGDAAMATARALKSQAAVTGFIQTLTRQQKERLLQDPGTFQRFIQESGQLSQDMQNITPDKIIDAGIKANGGQ